MFPGMPGATLDTVAALGDAAAEGDHGPSPTMLPARTCTWYLVPLVSPVMWPEVEVLVVLAFHSVHVSPLSDE